MSEAVFIPWQNHLAEVMRKPGGVRADEAVRRADENLEEVRENCLEAVDGQLEQIERLSAEGGLHPSDDVKLEIYGLSNDVHAVAGVFGLGELSQAAFSLCELVDTFRTLQRWNQAAVNVHLSSFRLLRHPDTEVDRSSVIQNLQRLTEQAAQIAQ